MIKLLIELFDIGTSFLMTILTIGIYNKEGLNLKVKVIGRKRSSKLSVSV